MTTYYGTNDPDRIYGTDNNDDTIYGKAGSDWIAGKSGNDTIHGGEGDGYMYGGGGADDIFGNTGDDLLDGGNQNDTLHGGAGLDGLSGGNGNDTLIGGKDGDLIYGGAGNDRYVYEGVADAPVFDTFGVEQLPDFALGDILDLAKIDAVHGVAGNQAFTFIGADEFTDLGQLRAYQQNGQTVIDGNTTGDEAADFRIVLNSAYAITETDIVL